MKPDSTSHWKSYEIEQTGQSDGCCDCCGGITKRIWGLVNRDGKTLAAYFVSWTTGRPDHGAAFDLVLGRWGRGASPKDRSGVALDFRPVNGAPQFIVVDAVDRFRSGNDLFKSALQRSDVIGTPLAPQVFALVDAVYLGDPRLDELQHW